jgi:hypothetical protein
MDATKSKVGDEVFYVVLERAKIGAINDSGTHAVITLLTGPQKGQHLEVPWEKLQSYPPAKKGDDWIRPDLAAVRKDG